MDTVERLGTRARRILVGTGLAVLGLGSAVLVGWSVGNATLVQVRPTFPPMVVGTAFGLVACGAGLLALAFERRRAAASAGLVAAGLGAAKLLEYLGGWNLGVDRLWMTQGLALGSIEPLRMSADTAVCLVLVGGCLVTVGAGRTSRWLSALGPMASVVVVVLGMNALLGYLFDTQTAFFGQHPSAMAIHTAAGLAAVGAALLLFAWETVPPAPGGARRWLPMLVGVAGLMVALIQWQALRGQERAQVGRETEIAAADIRSQLTAYVNNMVFALGRMAWRLGTGAAASTDWWAGDALLYVRDFRGLQAVAVVDGALRLSVVEPAGQAATVLAALAAEASRRTFETALARRQAMLTPGVVLPDGTIGMLVCVPVPGSGKTDVVVSLLQYRSLLDSALSRPVIAGYSVAILDATREVYRRGGGDDNELGWAREASVTLFGTRWRVRVWPSPGRQSTPYGRLNKLVLIGGLAWALLLGITMHLMLEARTRTHDVEAAGQQLREEVARRALAETERQRIAQAQERAEIRFRGLLESASDGIIAADADGRIVVVNSQIETMFGYSREDLFGQPVEMLLPGHLRESHIHHRQEFYAAPSKRPMGLGRRHLAARRKDGTEFPTEISLSPLRTDEGLFVMAVVRDVTDRNRLEDQLRQAQKMETVGRLAGGIAHDFNNSLTAIMGYADLVSTELPEGSSSQQGLKEIIKAAEQAGRLTHQLLAFSRKQLVQPIVLSLNAVIGGMEGILRRLISEDVSLSTVLHPSLYAVQADVGQIEQILMNLVANAGDAMPLGGRLTIETANVELDEAYARPRLDVTPGLYAMLAVSDTGHGMDQETQIHIFEPFFTTKQGNKGTGLGLATVYGIVKQSGGYVFVYSELNRGTSFKVYLPAVDLPVEARRTTPSAREPVGGSETVLLVEDEQAVRALISTVLGKHGYHVLEASSGEEALLMANRHSGPIHLLLSDTVLPGMNGPQLGSELTKRYRDTRALYMSGYTNHAAVRNGIFSRELAFLQKPFTPEMLLVRVREVLDTGRDEKT